MNRIQNIINFLINHKLILTTAESCTAGRAIHLLSKNENSGKCLDVGFIVYSSHAKIRLLGVNPKTIAKYTLSSEPIAKEMVIGALHESIANVAIAITGIAGEEPMDGIKPGTICFGWGFKCENDTITYSKTVNFTGKKEKIQNSAAEFSLLNIPTYYNQLIKEDFRVVVNQGST